MMVEIGAVEAIFRYPVKSMAGERLEAAQMGWQGIEGDRRLALRRLQDRSGFPWLTASKLPELILFKPVRKEAGAPDELPSHISTPDGRELEIFGGDFAAEIERRHGERVQMTHLRGGIFDEATVSVIAAETIQEIASLARELPDVRRFRPNVVLRLPRPGPFQEDPWVGGILHFGEPGEGPRVSVTVRDTRCVMINFDPDSARSAPEMLKSAVRANKNLAGVYGTVIRTGQLAVGQSVWLERSAV